MTEPFKEEILTLYEASNMLHKTHIMVKALIRGKELPAKRIAQRWFILKSDVQKYIDENIVVIDEDEY